MSQENNNSPHILSASANLLGLCFVVLTSLKVLKLQKETIIDEFTIIAIVLFMGSCLFSFLSIRKLARYSALYERIDKRFRKLIFIFFEKKIKISFLNHCPLQYFDYKNGQKTKF